MVLLNIDSSDIIRLVPVLGCLQGYIFCFVIMTSKKLDRHKSIFLSAHIFSASSLLLLPFIEEYFGWQYAWTTDSLIWISVPSTYFYLHMFGAPKSFNKDLLHLILLTIGAYAIEYWFFTYKAKTAIIEGHPELLHSQLHLYITIGKFIVFFGYLIAAVSLYKKHQAFIRDNFSNIRHYNLKWVRNLLIWNGLLIGYALVAFILSYYIDGFTIGKSNMTAYWALIIYIYYASIKGYMQKDIHIDERVEYALEETTRTNTAEKIMGVADDTAQTNTAPATKLKYQKSKLSESESKRIVEKIIKTIEQGKLYLEPELTLQDLADKAGEPSYTISQSLNLSLGKNFYELVNGYRVETAKCLLTNPDKRNLTILSIAFEAGFNSKTTFNNVFKKYTGQTPSAYMKTSTVKSVTS